MDKWESMTADVAKGADTASAEGSSGADSVVANGGAGKTGSFKAAGLDTRLRALAVSDVYPFHMPGHKRNRRFMDLPPVAKIDITEIDGFDNLHHADGVIKDAQARAAAMVHADRTWFLVNGSTCGLLAAIFACTRRGGRILVARNCHKAVYNAIELNGLNPVYIYPELHEVYGIYGGIDAGEVRRLLDKYPGIMAVVITSPTYEGVISDVERIARVVHSYGIPLIVDEAHGAHLGYSPRFERSAVTCGADLIIQSLHKTLPSMTQTAVLHKCGTLVDEKKVQKFLSVFQSSSPSYVMMDGMDRCMALLEAEGDTLFEDYFQRLERLRSGLKGLKNIRLLGFDDLCRVPGSRYDISKLVFFVGSWGGACGQRSAAAGKNAAPPPADEGMRSEPKGLGPWLYRQLLEKYHLQMEMASADYVLAMTSFCDTDEGFERLMAAMAELDERLESELQTGFGQVPTPGADGSGAESERAEERCMVLPGTEETSELCIVDEATKRRMVLPTTEVPKMNSCEASELPAETVPRALAVGRVSGEYLYVYPPGVPFVVPGEIIDKGIMDLIDMYQRSGLEIQGGSDGAVQQICVLKET